VWFFSLSKCKSITGQALKIRQYILLYQSFYLNILSSHPIPITSSIINIASQPTNQPITIIGRPTVLTVNTKKLGSTAQTEETVYFDDRHLGFAKPN
jgi:hypothetical protein